MSLVENIINQISSINGVTNPAGFDLNDDTFAKLLEKAGENNNIQNSDLTTTPLGAPAGFQIEPFDSTEAVSSITGINPSEQIEIKDIKVHDNFFSSLINDNSNAMNLAKKQAANAYNLFGKGFVDNLGEFVSDAASMIK